MGGDFVSVIVKSGHLSVCELFPRTDGAYAP
jgi:hypothetical protein